MSVALRQYIRKLLLTEEDYGGIGSGGGYGSYGDNMSGYGGMGGWGGKSILGIVGNPVADVVKTAVGSGKEVAAQAKGAIKTGLEASLAMVIPFISGEYGKISAETHDEVSKIKKQYEGLYKSNLDAIFNLDLCTLAFFLNPAAVITGATIDKLMYSAPDAALSILGFFVPKSGMKLWQKLVNALDPVKLQHILKTASGRDSKTKLIVWDDKNRRKLYSNVRRAMGIEQDPTESAIDSIFVLTEAEENHGTSFADVVKGIFSDPAIVSAMKQSDAAQNLRSVARKILTNKLTATFELAKKITTAPSFDALSGVTGTKSQSKTDPKDLEKVKAEVKERLVKSLSSELEKVQKLGVDPAKVGITAAYEKTIGQINGLPVNTGAPQNKVPEQGDNTQHAKEERNGVVGDDFTGSAAGRNGSAKGSR